MKTLIAVVAICILLAPAVWAQSDSQPLVSDAEIQLLRSDLQADKSDIIAGTMNFTEKESTAFWPVMESATRMISCGETAFFMSESSCIKG